MGFLFFFFLKVDLFERIAFCAGIHGCFILPSAWLARLVQPVVGTLV